MGNVITLLKRQIRATFHAPLFYGVMIGFLLVAGASFCRTLLQHLGGQIGVGELLFGAPPFWAAVLAAVTLLSMSVVAEERRTGTLETLLSAPVTDLQVVLGKYGGLLVCFVAMTAPLAAYFVILRVVAPGMAGLDPAPIAGGFLALWLVGACFLAAGVLCSALTSSQAFAATLTAAAAGGAFFLPDALRPVLAGPVAQAVLDALSSSQHIRDFSTGIVDSRPVILYLSGTAWCLFAAVKTLEARQWR